MAVGCAAATTAQGTAEYLPGPNQPQYVVGELIVKLKPEVGKILDAALQAGKSPTHTGLAWFDGLNARYGVRAIQPVFTHQPDVEEIRRRFPQRSRRAPPNTNAQTPSLAYVYQLTLRHDADIPQAAAAYAAHSDVEYAQPNYLATTQ